MYTGKRKITVNGKNLKIAIILPYFNENIGLELAKNAADELQQNKVQKKNIQLFRVAGALEIPFACQKIIKKNKFDAIIALAIVIRGETSHYELVTETTYHGLMQVQLNSNIPIIFGILACENLAQVKERISKNGQNKGQEFARAALIQTLI
ncbi:6,7-dimethyl-8-ribityllumazine synthase [Candidatus Peregrinibacteria bacterium]|nr:6,7-dimethyl-8-ribityllumazine synthase [Candidatus Peregrinibacteria bacterium]